MIKIYKCKCGYELHKIYDYKTPDKAVKCRKCGEKIEVEK